jgi:hypothetical protein
VTPTLLKPYVQGVNRTTNDSENPGDRFLETIFIAEH